MKDATITTPIAGVVIELKAQIGSGVGPAASIMTVLSPDIQVVVKVTELQLAHG